MEVNIERLEVANTAQHAVAGDRPKDAPPRIVPDAYQAFCVGVETVKTPNFSRTNLEILFRIFLENDNYVEIPRRYRVKPEKVHPSQTVERLFNVPFNSDLSREFTEVTGRYLPDGPHAASFFRDEFLGQQFLVEVMDIDKDSRQRPIARSHWYSKIDRILQRL